MKKIVATLIFITCSAGLWAQYKKASFFEKSGRTYGIGTQIYALGDGKGTVPGISLSFGRDQDGKRLFSFWELRYIPSYKFSFDTEDSYSADPVTVSGTSKSQWIYALNYGYHLLKNEEEKPKFQPYITAGFNIVILGGAKEMNYYETLKRVPETTFSFGFGGGLGGIINLSPKFSLKVEGGYTYQSNTSIDFDESVGEEYFMFTSHPYGSLGLRFRIVSE